MIRDWVAKHLPADEVLKTLLPRPVFRWLMAPHPHDYRSFTPSKPDGPQQTQCVRCGDFRWADVVGGQVDQGSGCPRFRRWFQHQSVLVKP